MQLARSLSNKLNAQEYEGELICAILRVKAYVEPLQSVIELQAQGEASSLAAGDVHYACINKFYHCVNLFWVGTNLSVLHDKIQQACTFMEEMGYKLSLGFILTMKHTVSMLLGGNQMCNDQSRTMCENKTPRLLRHV